jgi:hypothetical protein
MVRTGSVTTSLSSANPGKSTRTRSSPCAGRRTDVRDSSRSWLPGQYLVEHIERTAIYPALHQCALGDDQRRYPLSPGEAVAAESLDVDEVDPVTADSVSPQRSVLACRDPLELKPRSLAWSSSRLAITTSGLSISMGATPLPWECAIPLTRGAVAARAALAEMARRLRRHASTPGWNSEVATGSVHNEDEQRGLLTVGHGWETSLGAPGAGKRRSARSAAVRWISSDGSC